jgi:hypothetical protein
MLQCSEQQRLVAAATTGEKVVANRSPSDAMSCVTVVFEGFAAASELGSPTLDAVRREMEAADSVRGMFIYHSLAGGTGSGLGSALTQVILALLSWTSLQCGERDAAASLTLVSGCKG